MVASTLSPPHRLDPPESLLTRTAQVGTGVLNTICVPGDPFRDERKSWFKTEFDSGKGRLINTYWESQKLAVIKRAVGRIQSKTPKIVKSPRNVKKEMPTVYEGNEVKYLIDGKETFKEIVAAIRTATGILETGEKADHFIYMLNWWMDKEFELDSDEPGVNLGLLLSQASHDKGVMVRAMLWNQQFTTQNSAEADYINSLDSGAAILDSRGNEDLPPFSWVGIPFIPMNIGAQHQKVLCVLGEEGLICFCGGIDFNPDRVQEVGKGSPFHDVHCRIRGPAATDLVHLFIQRWNDHAEGQKYNRSVAMGGKGPLITLKEMPPSAGSQIVQIGRTFGDYDYEFAPGGELTAKEIILCAINNAKRFIYTEDQYFVGNPQVEEALCAAMKRGIQHLTVVLTHYKLIDLPLVQHHRRKFIRKLREAGGDRVRIFVLCPQDSNEKTFKEGKIPHTYVHSKLWIIDDEFAVIGSLNTNNRSWSHDSEVAAGIYDTSNDIAMTYHFAHWLRIELWKEHLNLQTPEGSAELADGVASAVHWLDLPSGARVQRFNEQEKGDYHIPIPILGLPIERLVYSKIIDPD